MPWYNPLSWFSTTVVKTPVEPTLMVARDVTEDLTDIEFIPPKIVYDAILGGLRKTDKDYVGPTFTQVQGMIDASLANVVVSNAPVCFGRATIDTVYFESYLLDDLNTDLEAWFCLSDVKAISFKVLTADPLVTGNVVLIPISNGVSLSPVVIAVGLTPAERTITFDSPISGIFLLRRDHANVLDTLKYEGDPVAAKIISPEVVK